MTNTFPLERLILISSSPSLWQPNILTSKLNKKQNTLQMVPKGLIYIQSEDCW